MDSTHLQVDGLLIRATWMEFKYAAYAVAAPKQCILAIHMTFWKRKLQRKRKTVEPPTPSAGGGGAQGLQLTRQASYIASSKVELMFTVVGT